MQHRQNSFRLIMLLSLAGTTAVLGYPAVGATMTEASDKGSEKTPRMKPEKIQEVIRANFGALKKCYEAAQVRDGKIAGKLTMRFTIERSGKTSEVRIAKSTIDDVAMLSCTLDVFRKLQFPAPKGGVVTVGYPLAFSPGD